LIDDNAKRLKKQSDETIYTLNYEVYKKEQAQLEEENKKYDLLDEKIEYQTAVALPQDLPEIEKDESREKRIESWLDGLTKDIYIGEAMKVIKEMK